MPRSSEHLVEEEEDAQPKKKRRRFASDKVERLVLVGSLVLIIAAIKLTISLAGDRLNFRNVNQVRGLDIYWVELASEVEPPGYDDTVELRIPLAERVKGGPPKPFVAVLRGPWRFGVTEMDKVALALGPPLRRGPGYLVYDLEDGKIRVGALFNANRLDTLYLTPIKPYEWTVTKRQIESEALQWEPPEGKSQPCGRLAAPARGFSYVACEGDELPVPAVYVQRISPEFRNPPHLRGLQGPPEEPLPPWSPEEYERLLAHYQESLRLKQKTLGPEHASLDFWRFETGRLLLEAGRNKDAAKSIREAMDALSARLGRDHDDVAAMRLWLPKRR
jgi:hypothetical protein